MNIGISIRTLGPQSARQIIIDCALHAEQLGLDSIWFAEHIAIPPDDARAPRPRARRVKMNLRW